MKAKQLISIYLAVVTIALLASCTSITLIDSTPSGADVYMDSQRKGTTPYSYSDTKIVGSATPITLKKDGFENLNVTLVRNERADVGAIIGGCIALVPFLWTMQYDPIHNYELQKIATRTFDQDIDEHSNPTNELVKLKSLLDEEAITQDDFATVKLKILDNKYDYNNSIADQIIKLKKLLDSKLLTKDEYTSLKNKLVSGK
jgi:PEGA domain/Short C-terminal domain